MLRHQKMTAIIVAILIVAVGLSWFSGCSREKEEGVKIGVVLALTGKSATYGKDMQKGINLAYRDAIDKKIITENQVQLIYEDGQGDNTQSINAFRKLIQQGVPAVLSAYSSVILSLKPIANTEKVLLFNPAAVNPAIEDADDYVFSIVPNANLEGKFLADLAYKHLGKKKAAVLYRDDPSGKAFRNAFVKEWEQLGAKAVFDEAHIVEATDFRPQIHKIKNAGADVIFMPSYYEEMGRFLKQAYELGLREQFLTYAAFDTPTTLEISGEAPAEGVIFSYPGYDPSANEPNLMKVGELSKELYGTEEVGYYSATFYDAAMLIFKAVANGARTSDDLKNYLKNVNNYDGITGTISFDSVGAVAMPLKLKKVEQGRFVNYPVTIAP